jgi:hypothetical protein
MDTILRKLEGGDRRSIGRVDEVVTEVIKNSAFFKELIGGLFVEDPIVRMRAADAIEKITLDHTQYLQPHKRKIIQLAEVATQQELRWHLAQIIPRLGLTPKEKIKVVNILFDYLQDKSNIVVTFSLQALADFAADDKKLRPRVMGVLKELTQTGSPAVKNRGKKLFQKLEKSETG